VIVVVGAVIIVPLLGYMLLFRCCLELSAFVAIFLCLKLLDIVMVDAAIVSSFENTFFAPKFKVGKGTIQRYPVFIWFVT